MPSSYSRRGSVREAPRYTSGDESDQNEILKTIISTWCSDLRILTYQWIEDSNFSAVLMATAGLLQESNTIVIRALALQLLLKWNQSVMTEVSAARSATFEDLA